MGMAMLRQFLQQFCKDMFVNRELSPNPFWVAVAKLFNPAFTREDGSMVGDRLSSLSSE